MEIVSIAYRASLGQCARAEAEMILAITMLAANLAASGGVRVRPAAEIGFDQYVAKTEEQIRQQENSADTFLQVSSISAADEVDKEARLERGEILIERNEAGPTELPGALIHHWTGVMFIPKATTAQVLAIVQDYNHLARYYSPEVVSSRLISRSGNDFRIAMRLKEHEAITVVLDTEYAVHYGRLDTNHLYSISRSTGVAEIANAGERGEHALADGDDHGFLWRLNTYWRFVQTNDGVFVECEAISLTRNVPTGLGWLVGSFIQGIPRDSLRVTLMDTRKAVEERK